MLRILQEQALLVVQDDVYGVPPDAPLALPASVQGLLATRIDHSLEGAAGRIDKRRRWQRGRPARGDDRGVFGRGFDGWWVFEDWLGGLVHRAAD